jgi:cytochrome c oxidase subunit 2
MSGIEELIAQGMFIDSTNHVFRVLQTTDVKTMEEIFPNIFRVFLLVGTLVGIVVIGYMIYNAYKYRAGAERASELDVDRPQLGELPEGGGGGKKLALSLTLSAIVVIFLIGWTYTLLLNVEGAPPGDDQIEVRVEGFRFGWQFIYPNGHTTTKLRVPEGRVVELTVTSRDVIHNLGIPAFNFKTDAIPGQTTDVWFIPDETGTYRVQCFELCGLGHSTMETQVIVMEPEKFDKWYANTATNNSSLESGNSSSNLPSSSGTSTSIESIQMTYNDRRFA